MAIADYTKAIELDPKVYNNRLDIYNKQGRYDLAIADCTKAIQIDPCQALPLEPGQPDLY